MADLYAEIKEDIQKERYQQLLSRYWPYLAGLVAVIILATAAYYSVSAYQQSRAEAAGARFAQASLLVEKGDKDAALPIFELLAKDGPSGYRSLAGFQAGTILMERSQYEPALTLYQSLEKNASDPALKEMARLRQGYALYYLKRYPQALETLKPLTEKDSVWRISALELKALAAYEMKDISKARQYFSEIEKDALSPAGARSRAAKLLQTLPTS